MSILEGGLLPGRNEHPGQRSQDRGRRLGPAVGRDNNHDQCWPRRTSSPRSCPPILELHRDGINVNINLATFAIFPRPRVLWRSLFEAYLLVSERRWFRPGAGRPK